MHIREELDRLQPAPYREELFSQIRDSPAHISELLEISLAGKEPHAWRAAWMLDGADERFPGLLDKYIKNMVAAISELSSKGGLRSYLRVLSRYNIPEDEQGLLIDNCFSFLMSDKYAVAIKAHAMTIIYKHVLIYPELKTEFINILEDQYESGSAGFKARAKILMARMEKL